MQAHREPHRGPERSLPLDGDLGSCLYRQLQMIGDSDSSPLERIAVALEGVLVQCRRIADCAEIGRQIQTRPVGEVRGHEGLPCEIPLAADGEPQPKSPEGSPYLGAAEAARYLGITVASLYGIVERGHVVPLRGPRRSYRFTEAMLDDYLKRRQ